MKKRLRLVISGKVQGVFFRAFVEKTAIELGVTGRVKNYDNGNVGVIAEGDEDKLKELLKECQHGPHAAHVDNVMIAWEKFQDEWDDFDIDY